MYNVDRVQNNLQRQYWTMDLSPSTGQVWTRRQKQPGNSNNRVVYFSPFSAAGQMTRDVSPAGGCSCYTY